MQSTIFLLAVLFVFAFLILIWININLKRAKKSLENSFKSMSFDVMQKNNQTFIDLAKENFEKYHLGFQSNIEHKQKELQKILEPVKESMDKLDSYNKDVETQRKGAYEALNKQIQMLIDSEKNLRVEASNLSKALKSPNIRGSWGQIHLKRVVELSGLLNNCDFFEQKSTIHDDKVYRPDLIIRLPGKKQIIVDAKTPIEAYLDAQEKSDENRVQKLKSHALNLKKHINDLSSKQYFSKFDFSPEYVILFLPAEAILSSAVSIDPNLLEMAAAKNIIIATPTTLIAILKTIAHIWKESEMSKNAHEITKLGKELHERLIIMNSYFAKLGKNLSTSVDAYNQAIASLNSRVLVSAKKLGKFSEENALEEINKTCSVNSLEKLEL